jgi:hypothetical protein
MAAFFVCSPVWVLKHGTFVTCSKTQSDGWMLRKIHPELCNEHKMPKNLLKMPKYCSENREICSGRPELWSKCSAMSIVPSSMSIAHNERISESWTWTQATLGTFGNGARELLSAKSGFWRRIPFPERGLIIRSQKSEVIFKDKEILLLFYVFHA